MDVQWLRIRAVTFARYSSTLPLGMGRGLLWLSRLLCCITVDYTYDDNIGFYNDAERNADDEYDEDQAEPWQGERVEPWQFDDDYVDDVEGRPKRGDEEQYRNEVEREALRELLAERAAEEARQALVAYLTAGERAYRAEEPQYLVAPNAEDLAVEEEEYNDLMNGDEEAQRGLYDEEPELTEKRFYPYSYEPYGGRWGALVPGAKRGDRDPYDRLYRLAEVLSRPAQLVLSRPAQLGSDVDDYKKKWRHRKWRIHREAEPAVTIEFDLSVV